jgi:hypothetical protein
LRSWEVTRVLLLLVQGLTVVFVLDLSFFLVASESAG